MAARLEAPRAGVRPVTAAAPARRAGLAWPRLPAAAELAAIGAGYLGYAPGGLLRAGPAPGTGQAPPGEAMTGGARPGADVPAASQHEAAAGPGTRQPAWPGCRCRAAGCCSPTPPSSWPTGSSRCPAGSAVWKAACSARSRSPAPRPQQPQPRNASMLRPCPARRID